MTATIDIETVAAQAREVRFARFAVTLLAGFFYCIGWTLGHLWLAVVFGALMIRQGWREGTGAQATTEAPPSSP